MMILLNPQAGGGEANNKWRRLSSLHPPVAETVDLCYLTHGFDLDTGVRNAIKRGDFHFVAAGGDGTVHSLLNVLMRLPVTSRRRVVLGAAGLGSSNDFHKPFDETRIVEGVPLRMDFTRPSWRDVGRVKVTRTNAVSIHYFIINASVGITAEGNAFFNRPDLLLGQLKRYSPGLAILYAAIRAITAHHNAPFTLRIEDLPPIDLNLTNLGIVKNPHFSGSLHYGTAPDYADGILKVYAAFDMGLVNRLRLLASLARGRFHHLHGTRSWLTPRLTVGAASSFPLELDGEILEAERAEFSVIPKAIQVCS